MDELNIEILDEIGGWGFTTNELVYRLRNFTGSRIRVPINSFGGDVLDGFAIYNILRGHKAEVETHIVGYAMSMGTVIAMAGDVVTMAENGYFMIHNPYAFEVGEATDMERTAEVLRKMTDDIASVYVRKTGLTKAKVLKMMADETWLTAKEAKDMGFVDKLTKGARIAASGSSAFFNQFRNYKNVPMQILNEFENGEILSAFLNESVDNYVSENEIERDVLIEQIADAAGVEVEAINQILRNEVNCPDVSSLEAFASVLSLSIDELILKGNEDGCNYEAPTEEEQDDDSEEAEGSGSGSGTAENSNEEEVQIQNSVWNRVVAFFGGDKVTEETIQAKAKKTSQKIDSLRTEVAWKNQKIAKLENKIQAIEGTIQTEKASVKNLQTEVDSFKAELKKIGSGFENLEDLAKAYADLLEHNKDLGGTVIPGTPSGSQQNSDNIQNASKKEKTEKNLFQQAKAIQDKIDEQKKGNNA